MQIGLYTIAALQVLGALSVVGQIGKARKPVTPGSAVFVVAGTAVMAVVLVLAAIQIH